MSIHSDEQMPTPQETDYGKARKFPQIYAAFSGALGGYIGGLANGWSSSVQSELQRNATVDADTNSIWYIHLTVDEMSWISSLLNIGSLIGSLTGGFLMDTFGRRSVLMTTAIPYVLGWLLITMAVDKSMLYIGRFIKGLTLGVCSVTGPTYIGEISTPNMRGVVGMFYAINISTGVFIASLLVWLDNWRWLSGICAIQPVFFFIAMYFTPESPYFLVRKDMMDDARKQITRLRGKDYNVEAELNQLKNQIHKNEAQSTVRFSDIFKPWAYKPVLLGVAIMIFSQFCGLNAALYYSVEIFNAAGSSLDARISSAIIKAVMIVMGVAASAFLVGRFQRRTLFITSAAQSCLSLCVLGGYLFILENDPDTAESLKWLPLVSLIVFVAGVGTGLVPLSWLISNELLPSRFRGPGYSIVCFASYMSSFIVTKTFVDLQRAFGTDAGAFWFYGGFCALAVLFGIFILPETKGKSPEEIQALFDESTDEQLKMYNESGTFRTLEDT